MCTAAVQFQGHVRVLSAALYTINGLCSALYHCTLSVCGCVSPTYLPVLCWHSNADVPLREWLLSHFEEEAVRSLLHVTCSLQPAASCSVGSLCADKASGGSQVLGGVDRFEALTSAALLRAEQCQPRL
jgi:hypothetical protein